MATKIHTPKDKNWTNALGEQVPIKFVPPADKLKESFAGKLLKASLSIEASLKALHDQMKTASNEIALMIRQEYELKYTKSYNTKGNFAWYNFDKSIKVEVAINDIVKWDGALMTEALTLLKTYINSSMGDSNVLIAGLVTSAFANTKGMIDTGKVFQILKYEGQIKNKNFTKACEIMKQAQSIDKTKLYMRIWEKQDNGEYRNINLNFSNI